MDEDVISIAFNCSFEPSESLFDILERLPEVTATFFDEEFILVIIPFSASTILFNALPRTPNSSVVLTSSLWVISPAAMAVEKETSLLSGATTLFVT